MAFKISMFVLSFSLSVPALAKIDMRSSVSSIQDGSYILVDAPFLIRRGTTSLYAAQKKARGTKKSPGPLCELKMSKAYGHDIFKKNLIIKSGTKMFIKGSGNDMILVSEDKSLHIPISCRNYVKTKKDLKESPKFSIKNMAQVFSRIGVIYLVDEKRTASN